MRNIFLKSLSLPWIILIFLVGCDKDRDYQNPENYGSMNWVCSVSDTNWFDTLATPEQLDFDYRISFTKPKDEHGSYAMHHYANDLLVLHQTVERKEFIDYSGPVRTIHHLTFSDELVIYRMVQGVSSYNYEYPYRNINGVRVKNIFKAGD